MIGVHIAITTDERTLRALLSLLQRVPMTDAESVFVENAFVGWFDEIKEQKDQLAAMQRMAELAKAAPAEAGLAEASDQATQESSLGTPSEPLPYDGVKDTLN